MAKINETLKLFRSGQLKKDPEDAKTPDVLKKYEIQQSCYPIDLFAENKPIGPYVMFYINVFEGSSVVTQNKAKFVEDNDTIQKNRKRGVAARMAETQGADALKVSTIAFSTVAGSAAGSFLGLPNAGSIGFGGALVGVEALESQGLNYKKSQKRLKTAVALHMPNDLSISYNAGYSTDDAAGIIAAAKIVNAGGEMISNIAKNIMDSDSGIVDTVGKSLEDIKGSISGLGDVGAYAALNLLPGAGTLSAISGIAANPKTQAVFNGVTPRTFQLNYSFFAKSEAELENIHRIIALFKENMLPEYKGKDEFLFVYPAEFDIEYYMGAEQNKYIHKHTSCVLERMSVNYTPDGAFNYFNSSGAPTKINVSLEFRELDILTRSEAEAGY